MRSPVRVPYATAVWGVASAPFLASIVACSSADRSGVESDGGADATPDGGTNVVTADAGASPVDGGHADVGPTRDAGGKAAFGCATDLDCNHGDAGTGVVCSLTAADGGMCIPGCHSVADCKPGDVCDEQATPHWACVPADAGVSGSAIARLALANVGQGACSTNTLGGTTFETSCTGNGGQPEYWCADFAMWVWSSSGLADVSELTAAAGSFYVYGQNHGTLSNTPEVGDAVVFNYQGAGVADHVAIVTQVNSDGTIETVSGDWGGQSGSEATFSSTSSAVLNSPAYEGTVGTTPAIMAMPISAFVAPVGLREP